MFVKGSSEFNLPSHPTSRFCLLAMAREQLTKSSWIESGLLPKNLRIEKNSDEFEMLWNLRPGYRNTIKLFGKEHYLPREQQVYGVSHYLYSGVAFEAVEEVPPYLMACLEWTNWNIPEVEPAYNMILVNWYFNGADNIGWHKDDEKQIIPGTDVLTISFGQSRKFKVKHDTLPGIKRDIRTQHNGYITMGGNFQKEFKHSIPKTRDIKQQGRRISITFRKFLK